MAKKSNKKNWIKGAIKRPDALTKKANKAGKSVAKFRDDVLANPNKYSSLTKKQANFAKTLASFQGGGNPYAMPTSAATSGYTSTMSGMAGAQQAQMQLAQLQQEVMAEQKRQNQAAADKNLAEKQEFAQQVQTTGAKIAPDLLHGVQAARNITKGVATAQQVAKASKNTANLLSNLNAYGQGAKATGQGVKAALHSMGPGPIAAVASLTGKGIERLSDDDDDTRTNFGEGFGRGLSGAGTGVGLAAMAGLTGPIGLGIAGVAGLTTALINQRRQKLDAREQQAKMDQQDAQLAAAEQRMFQNSMQRVGQDLGYNVGSSMTNSYLPGYQQGVAYEAGGDPHKRMLRKQNRQTRRAQKAYERASKKANRKGISPYKEGGEMIKRADGSYSQRGLWDNIRANKGSGKKPTKEMLEQEKKIKSSMESGGYTRQLPGGAIEFIGPKHAQGGIRLDKNTEVEGGETMDKVIMRQGGAQDYIFSDYLKMGGKTFATRHKEMLNKGASQKDVQNLARMQEEVARREGRDENGPRDPNAIMKLGGKYQPGGNPWMPSLEEDWAREGIVGIDMEGFIGGTDYGNIGETGWGQYYTSGPGQYNYEAKKFEDNPEDFYDAVYSTRANDYFDNNPEEAYKYLQEMVESTHPNAENFRKKLLDADGNMLPQDRALAIARELATDKKLGAFHMFLPQGMEPITPYIPPSDIPEPEPGCPCEDGTTSMECCRKEIKQEGCPCEDGSFSPKCCKKIPPNVKNPPLMPWQLIGPFAELSTKYPQPDKIAAQPTGRIKLPRVNFNAERAALAGNTNAANKYIESQAAGPGAIAAKMATNEKQRMGNLEIANAEARANKELATQEELGNLQASQFDSTQSMRASMFNAESQNLRDRNEYEKRMLAFNQLGTNMAQYGKDLRSYKAEERLAEASQINGEYTRQLYLEQMRKDAKRRKSPYYGMSDTDLREQAAQMTAGAPTWNAQNEQRAQYLMNMPTPKEEEKTESKYGGYVGKFGGIKRRR